MRRALVSLLLAVAIGVVGFADVPEAAKGLAELAVFGLFVIFVVLMVSHLAEDR